MARIIDPRIVALLDASGEPWSLESRRRHRVIRIRGVVVQAVPQTHREGCRHSANALANVRRHIRLLHPSPPVSR